MLGTTKSFRTSIDKDLIKKNGDFYYIDYEIMESNTPKKIEISFDGNKKTIYENKKQLNLINEFIGKYCVVTFSPNDIRIVTGEPKTRRKFIDVSISMMNRDYFNSLVYYNKLLKERNELLKDESLLADNNMLTIYTNKLIEFGKNIIKYRTDFINQINTWLSQKIKVLSNNEDFGNIEYKPNVSIDMYDSEMLKAKEKDLIYHTTTIGPHKDDFVLYLNNIECSSFGSQGQIKTAVLSLKLCLIEILKMNNDNIIIILDDVFGELDMYRQNQILKLLDDDYQVFITTTTINNINKDLLKDSTIINIERDWR